MSERIHFHLGLSAVVLGCMLVGCAVPAEAESNDERGAVDREANIIGGSLASAYPESALIDFQEGGGSYICSGSLIAPRVVLTAGHCVDGAWGWKIKLPFANNQTANGVSGATYDWAENGADYVNPNHHDIGLVFLDKSLTLTSFPVLASAPIGSGSSIVNIGRINNGAASFSALYVSKALGVSSGNSYGFPYDYVTSEVIQSGDSGGPDILTGSSPHKIVAVNSGAGGGTEVLARVDLLYSWIQQQIAANGGSGSSGGSSDPGGGSTDPGGGSTAGCTHDICSAGVTLASTCDSCAANICASDPYCCSTEWDAQCVSEVTTICGQSCDGGSSGGSGDSTSTCAHPICSAGTKLTSSCDTCAATVCGYDPYCCSTNWDAQCVGEVTSFCGQSCY